MVQVRNLRQSRWPAALCIVACTAVACGGEGSGPPSGPTEPPPRGGSGQTVEVIAVGDIGWCGSRGTSETAQLAESLSGWLLLVGDIAYPNGSASDFQRCFDPAWGRFRGRWYPVPGNHDYLTPGASAYFDY